LMLFLRLSFLQADHSGPGRKTKSKGIRSDPQIDSRSEGRGSWHASSISR
jgi:hypothetical protein